MTDTTPSIDDEIAACKAEYNRLMATDRGCGLEHDEQIRCDRLIARLTALEDKKAGRVRVAPTPVQPKLVRHPKKRKRSVRVPNACRCEMERYRAEVGASGISLEGGVLRFPDMPAAKLPRPAGPAKSAYDLCTNIGCQVRTLFWLAIQSGKHPAEFVKARHEFDPTEDDRDQLDWVCLLNAREWLGRDMLRYLGRVPAPRLTYPPRPYVTVPTPEQYRAHMAEVHAVDAKNREIDAAEQAAVDAAEITETTFADFLTTYRSRA